MNVSDLVTRISHNHDVIFKIIFILDDKVILKGINYRLTADSPFDDLRSYQEKIDLTLPTLEIKRGVYPGKILHIDGDKVYVNKAREAYQKYGISANCIYIDEELIPNAITSLLMKDRYDILVITGHDYYKNEMNGNQTLTTYENSINFVGAVQRARNMFPDLDSLIIIAGACQSNYEALIASGANFASSPTRENIHMLDPIIVASVIATTSISEYVSPSAVVDKTISQKMGGIESKGKARVHYNGERYGNFS